MMQQAALLDAVVRGQSVDEVTIGARLVFVLAVDILPSCPQGKGIYALPLIATKAVV